MPEIDLDSIKLAVMEALDQALGRQLGQDASARLGGGGEPEMPAGLPGEEGAEMGLEPEMGGLEGAGEALPEDSGAPPMPIEEEEPPQQSRAGWRPWMTRPPGS